eukprot:358691-Chlamydomonas_euryale.AAC.2
MSSMFGGKPLHMDAVSSVPRELLRRLAGAAVAAVGATRTAAAPGHVHALASAATLQACAAEWCKCCGLSH